MIRKANATDLESINDIYNQAVLHGFQTADTETISLEERTEWFKNHDLENYPVFVVVIDEVVVGWLSLSAYRHGRKALSTLAEISYYVHNNFQGQGIGSELMRFALKVAPEYGFENLVAILLGANAGSIKLLEKFNFKPWGVLPNVARFGDEKVDHLYYGLVL